MDVINSCPICSSNNLRKSGAVIMPFLSHRIFDWKPFEISNSHNLKTIKSGNAYQLCNSCLCNNCNHLFTDVRFSESEMAKLYKGYRGKEYCQLREKYEPGYIKRNNNLNLAIHYIKDIENFIKKNIGLIKKLKILDWGGGNGINTPFQNTDHNIYIHDVSNVDTINKKFVKLDTKKQVKFDLITSLHVFEHLPYPNSEIKKILKFLKKNGYLYIEVPKEYTVGNNGSISKNKLSTKRHWHEHINFYSKKSLTKFIELAGLELIKIQSSNVNKDDFKLEIFQVLAKKIKN